MAGRGPGVKRPEAGENCEANKDQGEHEHLKVGRERVTGEVAEGHRLRSGDDVRGDEADEDHRTADEGVEHQLHRAIFTSRGAPDSDKEVFGDNDDFVKDEKKEQVVAEKHAVDGANEHKVKREEFLGAIFNVPGEENAGDGDDAGKQDEGETDAIYRQVILDAERRNPGHASYGQHFSGSVLDECS